MTASLVHIIQNQQSRLAKSLNTATSGLPPGLFDTHIHGLLGHDVTDGDWDAINEMSEGAG